MLPAARRRPGGGTLRRVDAHRANVHRLVAEWQAGGLSTLSPPSAAQLRAFEERLQVRLPDDVRAYFEITGGFAKYDLDGEAIGWWPLDRVVRLANRYSRLAEARGFLVVADALIEATLFAIQCQDGTARPRGTVIEGDGSKWRVRTRSWSDFVAAYLHDPGSITVWGPEQPDDGPSR